MMFMQVMLNLSMLGDIADVKNAFCQSDPLSRAQGHIYVEPCDGANLPPGSLILLLVNVYGLDDAPMAWRKTVVKYLESHGFVQSSGTLLVAALWKEWSDTQYDAARSG
eukprot:3460829-Pyramimonas_sp.AAC.1